MTKANSSNRTADPAGRPFPWKCGECGHRAVKPLVFEYATPLSHDGRVYAVAVPELEAPRCEKCGHVVLTSEANRRIDAAFRQQLQLLAPEAIRHQRDALGLTQKELAARLGIADATLSRWETGAQIQQRAMDNLLRLFFSLPAVRSALTGEPGMPPVCVG